MIFLKGDFRNVNKNYPQIQTKVKDVLDKYNWLPYIYQAKIGYDTLIQSIFPKELINLMGATIVDIDIELKLRIIRFNYLESKFL